MDEINTFNKELIHFFNIDKFNSSIYIYLEIEGKKIKTENKINYYKLVLKDIKKEKEEIICLILENIELKILIRIFCRKEKNKINEMDTKEENNIKKRTRLYTQYNGFNNFNKPGLTIQDKIKIFSGEFIKRKIYRNEKIPGKLKIPEVFLQHNDKKDNNKNKEQKKESEK